ncbi:MAG: glycerate kinase, partial [Muribaculaceae bacterium]|nr:glycerate kinase [Muribaculaceae bacterium]
MSKYVVACDSFKGCLNSAEVNEAAAAGIRQACPDAEVVCVRVADGGEGTVEAYHAAMEDSRIVRHNVLDPLGRPVEAAMCICADGTTAILETAAAAGLTLLGADERNPMLTSSYGLGQQIAHAISLGCTNIIVGLGGSATNDGGTGMMQALGFRFIDSDGNPIDSRGGQILDKIATIDATGALPALGSTAFTALCDVTNRLTGSYGATIIYGKQKGADQPMMIALESGMMNYAKVLDNFCREPVSQMHGSGAAGGIGAALLGFLKAEFSPGIHTLLSDIGFDKTIAGADLIITGEGSSDFQSFFGKVPTGVNYYAKRQHIPVINIAGAVTSKSILADGILATVCIQTGPVTLEEAMHPATATANITQTVEQILRIFTHTPH